MNDKERGREAFARVRLEEWDKHYSKWRDSLEPSSISPEGVLEVQTPMSLEDYQVIMGLPTCGLFDALRAKGFTSGDFSD